jgi:hypothetical protein
VLGVLALFGVLVGVFRPPNHPPPILLILRHIGTIGTIAILINSNKKPIDSWGNGIAPAVYLAIASVACNALLAYTLTKGLTILFWKNTLQGHTVSILKLKRSS